MTMQFAELATVKHRVRLGVPLPFNVRHADTTLLLARGQQIASQEQLDALFERGALVDMAELRSPQDLIRQVPRDQLPGLWGQCHAALAGRAGGLTNQAGKAPCAAAATIPLA